MFYSEATESKKKVPTLLKLSRTSKDGKSETLHLRYKDIPHPVTLLYGRVLCLGLLFLGKKLANTCEYIDPW